MNDKIEKEVITLPPFKKFCMTIGELPSSYIETMTYYEMLVWFCNYLGKTVIPTIDNNAEAVIELQNLFVELQAYVNDYFDNLDVQEEINNKLDDMAESGELTDIIAQYLGLAGMLVFNTINDMKNATNLVNGSICKTLGYYNINDGGEGTYKILTKEDTDVENNGTIIFLENNLKATLIYNEINIKQFGAVGDGITDDSEAFINAFALNKKLYYIPKGKYIVTHNICDLININHDIKIYGDGSNLTRLKLKDNCITANSQPMFYISNDGENQINIEIRDLFIDMNKTNNDSVIVESGDEWALQWCHGLSLISNSIDGINAKIENIEFYDCIADGVCFGGGLDRSFDNIILTNIVEKGRNSTRDGVTFTADFNNAVVNNCILDAFEIEINNLVSTNKHNFVMNDSITNRFDVDNKYNIETDNFSPYLFNNCILNNIITFSNSNLKFNNCNINLSSNSYLISTIIFFLFCLAPSVITAVFLGFGSTDIACCPFNT